jgi:hypothetical protein
MGAVQGAARTATSEADDALTDKEKTSHEQGLVSVLRQIHDDLAAAVFEAYGWPVTLTAGGTGCLQLVCEAQEVISRCCGGSGT